MKGADAYRAREQGGGIAMSMCSHLALFLAQAPRFAATCLSGRKSCLPTAKNNAYGQLPDPNSHGSFRLSGDYVTTATQDVALQLSKAGVRLALVLNNALRRQ
jgi:hypothetical protein